jgi:hypothetical protein
MLALSRPLWLHFPGADFRTVSLESVVDTLGGPREVLIVAVNGTNLYGGRDPPISKMVSMLERGTSLQLGVFRFGLLENREFGIGVFPEVEEILIRASRFRNFPQQRIGSAQLKMG